MSTGYTAYIKDGVSFEDFAMRCARAFGALVMMRDEPCDAAIPDEFKIDDYHKKQIESAKRELTKVRNMTKEQIKCEVNKENNRQIKHSKEQIAEKVKLLSLYQGMLDKAKEWVPPTHDHEGLKKFMIEQIEGSIEWDCNVDYYEKQIKEAGISASAWKKSKIQSLKNEIEYHTKEYREEIERTTARNKWLKDLRLSLYGKQ